MRFANHIRCFIAASLLAMLLPTSTAASSALTADDFVHAEGCKIIGTDGEPLQIKGMALGNNVYTIPYTIDKNHHTEATYKELADIGFNSVRFYLNYQLLEQDDEPYTYSEEGFRWLDQNVQWAKKYGIGIIFNMHYPQGGYQSQGNGMSLWTDTENQKRLIAMWRALAERYANEPTVWGYGLINEPIVPYLQNNAETIGQCSKLMNDIANAIRSVSPYQAIFAETGISSKDTSTDERVSLDTETSKAMYFTLKDDNVIYEFHFYLPFSFTHQGVDWANSEGVKTSYPSEKIAAADYESYWVDCITAEEISYDKGWHYFETPAISATTDYNIAYAVVAANYSSHSYTYIDDLRLIEIAPNGSERVLDEYSFSESAIPLSTWSSDGTGKVMQSSDFGYRGGGSMKIGGADEWFNANGQHFEMKHGYKYKVSGHKLGDTAEIRIDLAKATNISYFNKEYLEKALQPYIQFSERNEVPLYLGEFGVIRHGFEEERNGEGWVADMIDLCNKYDLGFNYHAYHEGPFGLYQSDAYILPAEKDINKALREVFRQKLTSTTSHKDPNDADSTAALQSLIDWIISIV